MRRSLLILTAAAAVFSSSLVDASAVPRQPSVAVVGAVAAPHQYSSLNLQRLPTTSAKNLRTGESVRGVSLAALVAVSDPVLPAGKNTSLRVTITVSNRAGQAVTVALGELDPGFGNHLGLIAFAADGPELVFPTDSTSRRTIARVTKVDVAVATPATPTAVPLGGVQVSNGVVLSAAQLAQLPATTRTVTFLAGTASQQHTESGPSLADVLRAAHVQRTLTTSVAAIGGDGYVAVVTPAEATDGGRPLLLSTVEDGLALTQPRLIADGDVKGGRDVSGVVGLAIGG